MGRYDPAGLPWRHRLADQSGIALSSSPLPDLSIFFVLDAAKQFEVKFAKNGGGRAFFRQGVSNKPCAVSPRLLLGDEHQCSGHSGGDAAPFVSREGEVGNLGLGIMRRSCKATTADDVPMLNSGITDPGRTKSFPPIQARRGLENVVQYRVQLRTTQIDGAVLGDWTKVHWSCDA